jgi:hypothetical protein
MPSSRIDFDTVRKIGLALPDVTVPIQREILPS